MLNASMYLPKLKEFEGSIPFMYLDTTGNVTVGVGNLLPTVDAARQLAFVRRASPARAASPDEIQTDFDAVGNLPSGKEASFYKPFTKLDLPLAIIDSLLATRVAEFQRQLIGHFPDYPRYPEPACAAIFDMAFNLGVPKLMALFPSFVRAVNQRDWPTAARECKRNGIGAARNNWAESQFASLV